MKSTNPILHLFAPGPLGGAEKVVIAGMRALLDAGAELELWLIREKRAPHLCSNLISLLDPRIVVRVFDSDGPLDLRLLGELRSELSKASFGLIHTHGFKAALYAFCSRPKRIPQVHTHHGRTAHTFKVRVYEWLESQVMKRIAQNHAVSLPMARLLRDQGIPAVELIENPLTLTPIQFLPLPDLPIQLLYVGRLSPEKGVDVLLQALALMPDEDWKLTVVGDGIERSQLEALAEILPAQSVTFVGFQENVASFLSNAHVLVMPSHREGMPLTLIEALSQGLPVVASDVGGIPDLVEKGVNGVLVEPGNIEALSAGLRLMLSERKRFAQNGILKAPGYRERFSSARWAQFTLACYAKLPIQR